MERNLDLIRQILLEIEQQPFEGKWIDVEIEDHTPEEITYHVMLLHEAGLIEAINLTTYGSIEWKPKRLTWQGHEFLDASRNDVLWKKAKATMREKGLGLAIEVVKALLIELAKGQVLPP
jgi:hypothetical protein